MAQSTREIRKLEESRVYRNIFTAEVDVWKSLNSERRKTGKDVSVLPVAKIDKPALDTGILTQQQKLWTNSKPNQRDIENPVLNKFQRQLKAKRTEKSESYFASKEVRGLNSEVIDKDQAPTGIIDRIQANRKERHESVLEDMYQELALINSELEPQIDEACTTVKEYLDQNLQELLQELAILETEESLMNFSLNDFRKLWSNTKHHTLVRQSWIDQLDSTLESIEADRAKLIQEVFKAYAQKLVRIAHLMPADVHKLMESESLAANQTLLANKKYCADLIRRLKIADIERERSQFLHWKTRIKDWKNFKKESALHGFSSFMSSPAVVNPSNMQKDMNSLTMQQKKLNQRRLDLLKVLKDMRPPNSTKTAVYQWHNSLTSITEQLDELHEKYKSVFHMNYEKLIQDCEEELNRVKTMLFNEGVLTEEDIDQLSTEQMLPLIGEKRARFDYELEKYEKYTDEISAAQKQEFRSLFKYLQGAAHIWDSHELALIKEERELQERLDKNRKEHDTQNQIKEAKLDIVLDRMRQDASEEVLKMSLKQSLEMLEEIKKRIHSYYDFHSTQVSTTKQYPSLVEEEIKRYDDVVCKYFGVGRKKMKTDPDSTPLNLSTGAIYYIYPEEEEDLGIPPDTTATARTSYTFLTDDQEEEIEVMPYVESFDIKPEVLKEAKANIRKEHIEHLETWKKDALTKAENVMTAKGEELSNELDLRLHLHEPRIGRIERTYTTSELTDKFKSSVEALENTFINATKSHELLSIKDEVGNQLDEYMAVIRASLRKFRQDLDEMLNNLRNSNAKFRRLLKIFSEGGNFCPEEVDEFRKKLEHMASKIDNAEGSMMAELEGMETKRLDSAREFSGKLEEKFKQHLFDLTFLEKIARWLTNIQVKIKSEVADSNSQAQKIAKMIATFDRRIDVVLRPNLDREQINAVELHDTLMPILETFHERVSYLDCAIEDNVPPPFNEQQAIVSKTETPQDEKKSTSRSRSRRLRQKDSEASITKGSKTKVNTPSKAPQALRTSDSESRPSTVQNAKVNSATVISSKVFQEGDANKLSKTRSVSSGNRQNSFSKPTNSSKFDKKYTVFGDGVTMNNFLSRVMTICRDGLDGLLNTADLYYRQKGNRQSTRSHAIHDNFDVCAEALIHRLKSYEAQAQDYHNSCIQELRAQLTTFGKSLVRFPSLIVNYTLLLEKNELLLQRNEMKNGFMAALDGLERQKRNHKTLLRPTLGHPNNRHEMANLNQSEDERKLAFENIMAGFLADNKEMQERNAVRFVQSLNHLTDKLLWQFDNYLTTDDVQKGKVPPKPKTEKQLLREKMVGSVEKLNDEKDREAEKVSWQSLSAKPLVSPIDDQPDDDVKNITCRKVTAAHKAVIDARDCAFQKYRQDYECMTEEIDEESKKLQQDEIRWSDNWKKSINKIMELY
eukprot:gene16105-17726_t